MLRLACAERALRSMPVFPTLPTSPARQGFFTEEGLDVEILPAGTGPDLASGKPERVQERRCEIREHALERVSGQQLRRAMVEQPRLLLATRSSSSLVKRTSEERSHDRRDDEKDDQRNAVLPLVDTKGVVRRREEEVQAEEGEGGGPESAPEAPDGGGRDDAEHVERHGVHLAGAVDRGGDRGGEPGPEHRKEDSPQRGG